MKKFLILTLLTALVLSCVGCRTVSLPLPGADDTSLTEFDALYYAHLTPSEYLLHLQKIFSSILPVIDREADLGLGNYVEVFGADKDDLSEDIMMDVLYTSELGNRKYSSQIPVFYGLLLETELYLQAKQINYDELASDYGKAHALRGQDIQAMVNLLFRKEVSLSHAAVAGAQYIPEDDLYVYDSLINPYQPYLDKGWTLEFTGSDLELTSAIQWGEGAVAGGYSACFFYDSSTAQLYNPYGEKIGYTNNIDGLRTEADGGLTLRWCSVLPRSEWWTDYIVRPVFDYGTKNLDTPILQIECGSTLVSSVGAQNLPETALSEKEIIEIENTFFDDYYRDPNAGSKISNYFITSFYSDPADVGISMLPTQDVEQLSVWCQQYLGIEVDELSADLSTLGTKQSPTPYIALQSGRIFDDILQLNYYNEIMKTNAVLTLQKTDDGYRFVSNLPAE